MRTFTLKKYTLRLIEISLLLIFLMASCNNGSKSKKESGQIPDNPLTGRLMPHLDHSAYFKDSIDSPQKVTRMCIKCHPNSS